MPKAKAMVRSTALDDGRKVVTNIGPCAGCGTELPHKYFCHGCDNFICEPCDCRDPRAVGVHDLDAHFVAVPE